MVFLQGKYPVSISGGARFRKSVETWVQSAVSRKLSFIGVELGKMVRQDPANFYYGEYGEYGVPREPISSGKDHRSTSSSAIPSGAPDGLRVVRILRSLRILRFCSRRELFTHPTPVTRYNFLYPVSGIWGTR